MLQRLNPEGLYRPEAYSQVVVGSGLRLVFVSGQVALNAEGEVVAPGDMAGQARQAYANVGAALAGAGGSPADVTKLTTYVVRYSPEHLPLIAEAREAVFASSLPASTLVGVEALARPEFLIEVEAVAVLDLPAEPG
jgi:enamine deaminase RidA (YjgF/YER057c/UK114 family)